MNKKFLSLIRSGGSVRPDPNPEAWWEPYVLAFSLSAVTAVLVLLFTSH